MGYLQGYDDCDAADWAVQELRKARASWPKFNSAHEGFAILKEEVDELWEQVKINQKKRDPDKLRKEAIQVAAMALRFIEDICDGENHTK